MSINDFAHFFLKNSGDDEKHVCTVHVPNEKDAMSLCLDRKEVRCATLRVHTTGTGRTVETQDVFFWRLASRSAPTGLATVLWIGCINTIK